MRQADIKQGEDYLVRERPMAFGNKGRGYRATVLKTGVPSNDHPPRTIKVEWQEDVPLYLEKQRFVSSSQVDKLWSEHRAHTKARQREEDEKERELKADIDRTESRLSELLPPNGLDWLLSYERRSRRSWWKGLSSNMTVSLRADRLIELLEAVRAHERGGNYNWPPEESK